MMKDKNYIGAVLRKYHYRNFIIVIKKVALEKENILAIKAALQFHIMILKLQMNLKLYIIHLPK